VSSYEEGAPMMEELFLVLCHEPDFGNLGGLYLSLFGIVLLT